MTNLEAIQLYIENSGKASAILNLKSIDPTLSDQNDVSMAWGMIYASLDPNYKAGMTSITYTSRQLSNLRNEGIKILRATGIYYRKGMAVISSVKW